MLLKVKRTFTVISYPHLCWLLVELPDNCKNEYYSRVEGLSDFEAIQRVLQSTHGVFDVVYNDFDRCYEIIEYDLRNTSNFVYELKEVLGGLA